MFGVLESSANFNLRAHLYSELQQDSGHLWTLFFFCAERNRKFFSSASEEFEDLFSHSSLLDFVFCQAQLEGED